MQELSPPAKAVLMAAATLMIGFSSLVTRGANEPPQRTIARGDLSLGCSALTYISWPKDAFDTADSPFVIAVVGQPGTTHQALLAPYRDGRRRVLGRAVTIRDCGDSPRLDGCHVLFVLRTCPAEVAARALDLAKDRPILTLGDTAGFAASGGVIGVVPADRQSVLELNLRAARAQQLKIDVRLINVSVVVDAG